MKGAVGPCRKPLKHLFHVEVKEHFSSRHLLLHPSFTNESQFLILASQSGETKRFLILMGSVKEIQSKAELDEALGGVTLVVVVYFWAESCEASRQMDRVFSHLATDFPHVLFLRVEAEKQHDISKAYTILSIPYFIFFKDGEIMETLQGANPSSLANKISRLAGSTEPTGPAAPASLGLAAGPTILESVQQISKDNSSSSHLNNSIHAHSHTDDIQISRLNSLVSSKPIMVFLEGKYDAGIEQVFARERVECDMFDVGLDDDVKEGLKVMSNWSTFPQVYAKGEFIGGVDIILEMHESGELKRVLCEKGIMLF